MYGALNEGVKFLVDEYWAPPITLHNLGANFCIEQLIRLIQKLTISKIHKNIASCKTFYNSK